jgi:acyl-CoA synthetase (AMP-forming)/AMP-acid ligase II
MAGAQVVATPGFDSNRVPAWIDAFRPTILTAAPSLYRRLAEVVRKVEWVPEAPSLRLLVTGSDRTDPQTVAEASRILQAPMVEFYGLSEVAPLVATSAADGTSPAPGAVGRINPAWNASVLGPDGQSLPEGTEGEIALKGGHINRLVGRHAPQQRVTADGQLLTGDLGRIEGGSLFITGRVDDRINRGGEKIDPRAVEEVLKTHPSVAQVIVFPIPDSRLGQRVGAAVVAAGSTPTTEALQAYAAQRLFAQMVPETIVMTTTLPLNAAGKVSRAAMARALGLVPAA